LSEKQKVIRMGGVGLEAYLIVGAVLFVCGVVCMATKRNGIGVLMGVELVLNGANVNFVAFSRFTPLGLDGQTTALFVIVLAAAEAAVALAIALNYYNNHLTIDVDRGSELQG
jgi:NADH:ubiquinone oxidoreductase subunit K